VKAFWEQAVAIYQTTMLSLKPVATAFLQHSVAKRPFMAVTVGTRIG
jgi:hypothetical protein